MLSNTLVTNEVKNAASTEVEFERVSINGQTTEFKAVAEVIGTPHRISVSHSRSGSGDAIVRRSVIRFDKTVEDTVTGKANQVSAYIVVSIPERNSAAAAAITDLLAELGSLVFTLATNTFLYDGTGNGAKVLLGETL
jgi:hypothetical protein